ncbi:MAG: hypothetical protein Q3M30_17590 [Candidatus Electrothrix sp. Rat3]|nr:hypothetical protein [Candidatus Electrothrix rattekaaiensis]
MIPPWSYDQTQTPVDQNGSLDYTFYTSAALLIVGEIMAQFVKRPTWVEEKAAT